MREVILYGNHASGHSYKVRLFLALADLDRLDQELERLAGSDPRPAPLAGAVHAHGSMSGAQALAGRWVLAIKPSISWIALAITGPPSGSRDSCSSFACPK
jgi:hypothetical protein